MPLNAARKTQHEAITILRISRALEFGATRANSLYVALLATLAPMNASFSRHLVGVPRFGARRALDMPHMRHYSDQHTKTFDT